MDGTVFPNLVAFEAQFLSSVKHIHFSGNKVPSNKTNADLFFFFAVAKRLFLSSALSTYAEHFVLPNQVTSFKAGRERERDTHTCAHTTSGVSFHIPIEQKMT